MLGLSTLLVVGFAVVDLVRLPVGPYAMLGIAAALTVIGVLGARRPHVVRVSVPIADLPPDLEGFRIVQLSDLHIGPTLKRRFVERVVTTANALDPDVAEVFPDSQAVNEALRVLAQLAKRQAKIKPKKAKTA